MGSSSSKFRKHLQNGDEYAALQLFNSSSDLRKDIDPNCSYGDTYSHDTPMHYAARHAMKSLLRIFLYELGGNPNKKNVRNETSLHCVCMALNTSTFAIQQRRVECLMLTLQWRGAILKDGEIEKADLSTQDEKENTALHYAAASGLKRCVELLVSQGAPLFVENGQKQTPCDCAEKCGHSSIALYLESKMVFSNEDDDEGEVDMLEQMETEELYSGLRAQDLQEAKDQLLVETADMLRVPLFTAEALLRNHEWSREMLLEAWMDDAIACCEKCGVVPPTTLYADQQGALEDDLSAPTHSSLPAADTICDICASLIPTSDDPVPMACDHQFCRSCWQRYLTGKIQEGEAHNITCPGFECSKLVAVDIIETLVSRDMARRYLQFDIKAFVESNPHIKWCPYPGCGRAVKLPDSDNPLSPTFRDPNSLSSTNDFSHAVDCGNGHIFCWECLGEAHEPASCEHWCQWNQKMAEIKPEELSGTEEESEMAANCLWLITNSKGCPNCKSPIQKNEGCNHMKCSKCKHDFCWLCLEAWKKHSSATGGYFRCNRYEVVRKVEQQSDTTKTDAEEKNKKMQELNKFVHYYTRFKNHENSYKLEEPLISTAKEKMMVLAKAVTDPETAQEETRFVEDAVHQLLKARRVLKCCYVYGYYLEETGYKKPIFEFMQTELEECTESLSEMIARPYLRTPRHKIIQTAQLVQRKRHEFVTAIAKGLVPADTSPTQRKKRNKYSLDLDEDLRKALLASVQDDMTPQTSWVKDPNGRHTNLSAMFDWPEDSDDSDSEAPNPQQQKAAGLDLIPAICIRKGCNRPRAQNPRTGEIHDHCTIKCMRLDQIEQTDASETVIVSPTEYFDYQIDLLRALEMSRLHFQREMGSLQPGTGDRSPRSPGLTEQPEDEDSSDVHPPAEPLVLQAPPKGRVPRGWGWAVPGGDSTGSDTDLQRALDLSASTFQGQPDTLSPVNVNQFIPPDEERDLRMAIELSLREGPSAAQPEAPKWPHPPARPLSDTQVRDPHSEEYSTVVTRVPNKSVEDLNLEVARERIVADNLGACGGMATPESGQMKTSRSHDWDATNQNRGLRSHDWEAANQIRPSRSHDLDYPPRPAAGSAGPQEDSETDQAKLNRFGLIKDISVNNILTNDTDKTKDFDKKDFSQIYIKNQPAAIHEMERVFEPRPPYPIVKDEPGTRHSHLTPPPAGAWPPGQLSQLGHLPRQDVWVEQTHMKQAESGVGSTVSFSRSPVSHSSQQTVSVPRSPRESYSRSPRESNSRSPCEFTLKSPRESFNKSPRDSICRSPHEVQSRSPRDSLSHSPRGSASRSPREMYSHSPRDLPRPQPVFTFEPYATAGSVPDLLTTCPARCLAANAPRMTAPPRERTVHSCSDVGYDTVNPFDDDDPGPRLDAVLRSLHKLSTRLGENDEFLSSISHDPHTEEGIPSGHSNRLHGAAPNPSQTHGRHIGQRLGPSLYGGQSDSHTDRHSNIPGTSAEILHRNSGDHTGIRLGHSREGLRQAVDLSSSTVHQLQSNEDGEDDSENAVFV